jgi:hypothetical protein
MGTTSSCFGELMIAHYLYCVNQPEKPLASQAVPWYTIAIIRIGGIQLGEELFQLPKPQKRRKP